MIVVNLFGAPSAGKSTCAAYVFAKLKMARINVELVTEYAKTFAWEDSSAPLNDQLYIFGNQNHSLYRLKNKVDVAITDSPLLLNILYNQDFVLGEDFNRLVKKVFDSYPNMNYFLTRELPYDPSGRWQTEAESDELSKKLKDIIDRYEINYTTFKGNNASYDIIADEVLDVCRKLNFCK